MSTEKGVYIRIIWGFRSHGLLFLYCVFFPLSPGAWILYVFNSDPSLLTLVEICILGIFKMASILKNLGLERLGGSVH